jgi:hypothetical protein
LCSAPAAKAVFDTGPVHDRSCFALAAAVESGSGSV